MKITNTLQITTDYNTLFTRSNDELLLSLSVIVFLDLCRQLTACITFVIDAKYIIRCDFEDLSGEDSAQETIKNCVERRNHYAFCEPSGSTQGISTPILVRPFGGQFEMGILMLRQHF